MKPAKFELLGSTLLLCMLPMESSVALNLAANYAKDVPESETDDRPVSANESGIMAESFRDQLRSLDTEEILLKETQQKKPSSEPSQNDMLLDDDLFKLQQEKLHYVKGAMQLRYRAGESGLSELFESKVPLHVNFNTSAGRLGLSLTTVMLSSGKLPEDIGTQRRYGTLALLDEDLRSDNLSATNQAGLGLDIAYELSGFHLNVGTSPLGFEVSQQTAGLGYRHDFDSGFNVGINLSRLPVTDSLLSYAGLKDENTGETWGGVMKNAGDISVGFHSQDFGMYLTNTVAVYQGESVDSNDFFQLVTGLYFSPYKNSYVEFKTGLNLTYFEFEKNQRYFTLGHGGYFSPSFFYGVDVPFQVSYSKGRVQINANMSFGIQSFREDLAPFYPSNVDLQQELAASASADDQDSVYIDDSQNKLASQGGVEIIYSLMRTLSVRGGINFNRSASYNESHFTVGVEHRFGGVY